MPPLPAPLPVVEKPTLSPPASECDVLVVDDEPSFRSLLTEYLQASGYRVHEAANGRVALRYLTEHSPRLIVVDLFMPEADGLEVLRRVRQMAPAPPVLVMSGNTTFDLALFVRVAGFLGAGRTLVKPFPLGELIAAVRATIGMPRGL